jgi:hypothetical protein
MALSPNLRSSCCCLEREKDLRDAFAGESQANRTYLAFAKKAEQEGYKQVVLFAAASIISYRIFLAIFQLFFSMFNV